MAVLTEEFRRRLVASGEQSVQAIVRVSIPLEEAQLLLESRGVQIRRLLRLVQGVAVTAPARTLIALAGEPWVRRIEPDSPVRAYTS